MSKVKSKATPPAGTLPEKQLEKARVFPQLKSPQDHEMWYCHLRLTAHLDKAEFEEDHYVLAWRHALVAYASIPLKLRRDVAYRLNEIPNEDLCADIHHIVRHVCREAVEKEAAEEAQRAAEMKANEASDDTTTKIGSDKVVAEEKQETGLLVGEEFTVILDEKANLAPLDDEEDIVLL